MRTVRKYHPPIEWQEEDVRTMRRLKLLSGLSTLAAASALALSGCGKSGEGEGGEGEGAVSPPAASPVSHHAAPAGGEGEGEGGLAQPADKSSYLARLMMLHGHLKAGTALYAQGEGSLAAAHMKHPEDELYAGLKPMIAHYGVRDMAPELSALSASVEGGMPLDKVEEAFANVRAAAGLAAAASKPSLKETLLAVSALLREAAAEFDAGVEDGKVVNLKEYQDAYGFMTVAVETLGAVDGADEQEKTAVAVSREQAALSLAAAPSVAPPARIEGRSSTIYGAATRIELAARGLD
jgi:hypothetical protein